MTPACMFSVQRGSGVGAVAPDHADLGLFRKALFPKVFPNLARSACDFARSAAAAQRR
jgi:hypothetical protein